MKWVSLSAALVTEKEQRSYVILCEGSRIETIGVKEW